MTDDELDALGKLMQSAAGMDPDSWDVSCIVHGKMTRGVTEATPRFVSHWEAAKRRGLIDVQARRIAAVLTYLELHRE